MWNFSWHKRIIVSILFTHSLPCAMFGIQTLLLRNTVLTMIYYLNFKVGAFFFLFPPNSEGNLCIYYLTPSLPLVKSLQFSLKIQQWLFLESLGTCISCFPHISCMVDDLQWMEISIFSVRDQIKKIMYILLDQMVSMATIQLCHFSVKAKQTNGCGCVPINLYL